MYSKRLAHIVSLNITFYLLGRDVPFSGYIELRYDELLPPRDRFVTVDFLASFGCFFLLHS